MQNEKNDDKQQNQEFKTTLGESKMEFLLKLKQILFRRRKYDYSYHDYLFEILCCCK